MSTTLCRTLEPSLEICALEPWFTALSSKIPLRNIKAPALLASKVSWFNALILRVLGIGVLGFKDDLAIWGYVGNINADNIIIVELGNEDWHRIYSHKLPRFLALPLSEPRRVLIYVLIGTSGILVNLAVATLVHSVAVKLVGDVANPIASTTGFEASVLSNFTLHELITFRNAGLERTLRKVLERLFKYHIASTTSWLSQVLMATALPLLLRTPFWLAQLTGIIVGFIVNFILGYMYTWSWHRL